MKYIFLSLITLTFSFVGVASELVMHIEKSKFGNIYVYIENRGEEDHLILTSQLAYVSSDKKTEISPDTYVWIRDGNKIILKDSIEKYGPVLLKPGEVTFIKNPLISTPSGTVVYSIPQKWAKLHNTWAGTLRAEY